MKKLKDRLLKLLFIINTSIFIVSFSILFVLLFRPFYYMQIKPLKIEEQSGLTYNEIKEAYDDVIDYLTLNTEFKTGNLSYSTAGMSHFRDCKILFIIDFIILIVSTIILVIKEKLFKKKKLLKHNLSFWSGLLIISIFLIILITFLIIGFNKSFELFHNILFLGKTNWILDPAVDKVIDILPNQFFLNCGIFILSFNIISSLFLIIKDLVKKNK